MVLWLVAACDHAPTADGPSSEAEKPTPIEESNTLWPGTRFGKPVNSAMSGVTCFRGNPQRNYMGEGPIPSGHVQVLWRYAIGRVPGGSWAGVGWTGQPILVDWPAETREHMKFNREKGPRMEVIVGGLDGQIHFIEAGSGRASRPPIKMPYDYPIKGTITLDPRGYPVVYTGAGYPVGQPAYRAYDLTNRKELFNLPGKDPKAPKTWPLSDGNALILNDTLFHAAENGLLYRVALNSRWDAQTGRLSMQPKVEKVSLGPAGVESSIAVWDSTGFVSDNHGGVWKFDMEAATLKPTKFFDLGDDADATLVLDPDGNLYGAREVDRTAGKANPTGAVIKFDQQGRKLWAYTFKAASIPAGNGRAYPLNGGVLSTGALDWDNGLIFYTTAHDPTGGRGRLIALDVKTGELKWERRLRGFAWSSPIAVGGRVFAADSAGAGHVVDARTGKSLLTDKDGNPTETINLGANAEGSPIVWKGTIFIGVRGGAMLALGNPTVR